MTTDAKIDTLVEGIARIEQRLSGVENQITGVVTWAGEKFDTLDSRLTSLDSRFTSLDSRFTSLEEKVDRGFSEVHGDIEDLAAFTAREGLDIRKSFRASIRESELRITRRLKEFQVPITQ